jgi:hypothetical protein
MSLWELPGLVVPPTWRSGERLSDASIAIIRRVVQLPALHFLRRASGRASRETHYGFPGLTATGLGPQCTCQNRCRGESRLVLMLCRCRLLTLRSNVASLWRRVTNHMQFLSMSTYLQFGSSPLGWPDMEIRADALTGLPDRPPSSSSSPSCGDSIPREPGDLI